jgi:excisionase family DNA binding protein
MKGVISTLSGMIAVEGDFMETNIATAVESSGAMQLLSPFFTQDELARQLGITRKTLDRWATEGKGPKVTRIGRRILYSKKTVAAWLAACERDPHQRDRRFGSRKRKA